MFLAEGDFVLFFVIFFFKFTRGIKCTRHSVYPISKRYAKKKFVSKNVDQHN